MNVSRAKLVLVLMIVGGYSGGQLSPTSKAQDPEPFRIAVDVELVVLHPVVRDRKGRFVSDLGEQDFEVYEDGVRQSIRLFQYEDTPVTIGLVVDHSRSMLPKLGQVTAAARTFVQDGVGVMDSCGHQCLCFAASVTEHDPLVSGTFVLVACGIYALGDIL
jgi:hypothetical protein